MEEFEDEKIKIEDLKPDKSKTILTGIRPTGHLHIGHYLGAASSWKELQSKFDTYIEIADVQALTDNFSNPQKVKDNTFELVIDLLSIGIDPNQATLFLQSQIPEIAELTVYYSNLVTIARLQRNPTVKTEFSQKKNVFGDNITYGFLGYPVSQSADITAFNATYVPVGEDQLPMIEQCREIVRKFNSIYGKTLNEPIAVLNNCTRIKGLDGNEKMGKSLGNALFLADEKEVVKAKVMAALTDPARIKKDDPGHPDVCMVYYYHKLFSSKEEVKTVHDECIAGTRGCVQCKKELIDNIEKEFEPIREKRKYYEDHMDEVREILKEGTAKAKEKAAETLRNVKKALKLDY